MKTNRILILFTMLLLLAACHKQEDRYWLDQAEQYLPQQPDSAWCALKRIHFPENLSGKEKADYWLLNAMSRRNRNNSYNNDTLLKESIAYYTSVKDSSRSQEAFRLEAQRQEWLGNLAEADSAIYYTYQCLKYVRQLPEKEQAFYLSNCANMIGLDPHEALSLFQESSRISPSSRCANLCSQGYIYLAMGRVDSAMICYQKSMELYKEQFIAKQKEYPTLHNGLTTLYACAQYALHPGDIRTKDFMYNDSIQSASRRAQLMYEENMEARQGLSEKQFYLEIRQQRMRTLLALSACVFILFIAATYIYIYPPPQTTLDRIRRKDRGTRDHPRTSTGQHVRGTRRRWGFLPAYPLETIGADPAHSLHSHERQSRIASSIQSIGKRTPMNLPSIY